MLYLVMAHLRGWWASARTRLEHTKAGSQSARPASWRRSLYTIVIAETLAMLGFNISLPFLPFYIQDLGVSDLNQVAFWVGLINSQSQVAMAVAAPIWGFLADRVGRKPMLVRAMIAGSIILTLLTVATTVQQVAALRILQGALTGTIAAATTLVASMVPREEAGYSLGLLQAGVFGGSWLGPSVGGFLGGSLGYQAAFMGSGVMLFLAALMVMFLVTEERTVPVRIARVRGSLNETTRSMFGQPMLLAMIALLMFNSLSNSISSPVLALFVQTLSGDIKGALTSTGLIMSVTALTNAAGALLIGRAGNRLGRRPALLACLGVAALSCFPQMWARLPWQLLVMRGVMGFALGALGPIANAGIAEHCPEGHQGGVYGISTSLNAFGGAVGPLLGTFVVTNWALAGVFPATSVCLAIMVLMVLVMVPSAAPDRQQVRKGGYGAA